MNNIKSNLLVIEENPYLAGILDQTLTPEFTVTVAANGIEAVEWLERGQGVDFIITELNLPHFDGMELIQLIRTSTLYKNLPILVLSGVEDSATRIKCLELGADAYVTKPFNPLEVRAKVRAMLRRTESFIPRVYSEETSRSFFQWLPARS